jgi:hypothetical protein
VVSEKRRIILGKQDLKRGGRDVERRFIELQGWPLNSWVIQNTVWLILIFGAILVLSFCWSIVQMPKDLRGGVMLRLDELEAGYENREKSISKEIAGLTKTIHAERELIQSQLRALYQMRNDK